MLRRVCRVVAPGRVLDLGCGIGRLAAPIARDHPATTVIGFDTSPAMLEWAKAEHDEANIEWHDSLDGVGPLDGAWSVLVFQHLDHPTQRRYLRDLGRLLRPGARFALQWVTHAEAGPMNHPTPAVTMLRWVRAAGLRVESMSSGHPREQWTWLEAVRP
jgi:trans-aconitate 2-methyltransferase